MSKKWMFTVLCLILAVTVMGCSKKETAANADLDKQAAYTDLLMAEDKLTTLFHKNKAKDGTPIIDAVTNDKEKAKALLAGYFDAATTDKVLAHYITDKKADGAIVVNKEPFFPTSVAKTKFEDVTVEGDKKEMKITTKDGGVYTLVWVEAEGKYKVSGVAKK